MHKIRYALIIFLFVASNALAANELAFKFQGIQGEELKNAQARLDVLRKIYPKHIKTHQIHKIYELAPAEVKKALQPYGYYKPTVRALLTRNGKQWTASFFVQPGRPLKITKLSISVYGPGAENKALHETLKQVTLKRGDVLLTKTYEDTKDKLFSAANNAGYIKARFDKTAIVIDLKKYTASVDIHLYTGRRYYFGKTTFGQSPFVPSFQNRFLNYKQGQPFSNEKILTLQEDMAGSSYFSSVDITPDLNNIQNYQVPIHVETSVPRSQRYHIGLGYGTFTGPRLTAGVNLRRTTNTGQHFNSEIKLSQVLSSIAAKYYIPGKQPITDRWVLGGSYSKFNPKNGKSESFLFTAGYLRKILHFQTNLSINYLTERYEVEDEPTRNSNLLYPNLTVSQINTDDLINPTNGYSWNISLQGSLAKLFSTTNFFQAYGKGKYIYSPFSFSKIIGRAELGYTVVNDLFKLPLSMRYFAGGINSIRGFPDSNIGPGKYLTVGSLEYQNKVYGNIWGAVFYDIGAASNHIFHPGNTGVGVGVIYQSPVGPIKMYIARAISKKKQPYGVEFSIGPEF